MTMDEDEALGLAKDIFGTAQEVAGLSSRVGRCIDSINSKRPQIAQGHGIIFPLHLQLKPQLPMSKTDIIFVVRTTKIPSYYIK